MIILRKIKMLFVDPVLELALHWSRQAMVLKEKRLSDTFGNSTALDLAAIVLACTSRVALARRAALANVY